MRQAGGDRCQDNRNRVQPLRDADDHGQAQAIQNIDVSLPDIFKIYKQNGG
jgi:hypothetical protein